MEMKLHFEILCFICLKEIFFHANLRERGGLVDACWTAVLQAQVQFPKESAGPAFLAIVHFLPA